MSRPTNIKLNTDEYNQGLNHHPFMVSLDRCDGICHTLDDLFGNKFFPSKTGEENFKRF